MTATPKTMKSQGAATRSLNTSFQIDMDKDVAVIYTVSISASLTLSGGQTGQVFLEISPDNSTWQTISSAECSITGSLVVGVAITNVSRQPNNGFVPRGYYVRLRTNGTATFTYQSGQEVILESQQ